MTGASNAVDVLRALQLRREPPMAAEQLLPHQRGCRQAVEHLRNGMEQGLAAEWSRA